MTNEANTSNDLLNFSISDGCYLQLIYRPDNDEILGVHIFGQHAADLIHKAFNAMALGTHIQVCEHSSSIKTKVLLLHSHCFKYH